MSIRWKLETIRLLCGRFSYEDGEALFHERKVILTDSLQNHRYKIIVRDEQSTMDVFIQWQSSDSFHATCSCPLFHPDDQYCKHIAAALLLLHATGNETENEEHLHAASYVIPDDEERTAKMLQLFTDKPVLSAAARPLFDDRHMLRVEFICKIVQLEPYPYGFGIEMKIGPQKPYVVKSIRKLLDAIDSRISCAISQSFSYDPQLHCFDPRDEAVLEQFIYVLKNDSILLDSARMSERVLLIPPHRWESLLPLLIQAPNLKLIREDMIYEGFTVSDERLPLQFRVDPHTENSTSLKLTVQGLDELLVMEAYGLSLYEGKLYKLPQFQLKRLSEFVRLSKTASKGELVIQPEYADAVMNQVVPQLAKFGDVQINPSVSERLVQVPLAAKLYLDRVKDRLLADLEFHYGEYVFSPNDPASREKMAKRILIRDHEKERTILTLMAQSGFITTDGGYYLTDEEVEYDFLYHTLPQLEKLVHVYATSAVKIRIAKEAVPPKIKVEWDERTDWLEFKFEIDGIAERDIQQMLRSLEEKRRYYRLPNGALMPMETSEFKQLIRFLYELGPHKGEVTQQGFRLPVVRALHLAHAPVQPRIVQLGKSFRKLLEHLRNPDHLEFALPPDLDAVLRDYQKYGFQWMRMLAHYRFGGILADEMGLGKTVQSIAYLVSMLEEMRRLEQPSLIVCPASLMYNWKQELQRFAPSIRTVVADGSLKERVRAINNTANVDVIITSYPLLRRDVLYYMNHTYHSMILDEAQAFKNDDTLTAKSVKQLKARHRFALTGTPVENSLQELWSIYDTVFPGLFPEKKRFAELTKETVSKRIRPFMLRRLKNDVLKELPEKIEHMQATALLPEQKKLYLSYLTELRQETLKHLHTGEFQKNRIRILAGITRLRQLCCHPALFIEGYTGGSAKLNQLMELVRESRMMSRRILIFSQFTEMLKIIGHRLIDEDISYFYLDGNTPAKERVELCSRFNEGERDVFLLSLKAGGTGLNLTGADTIILYDLWWNPAVEQQAMDRAHRIGQKRVVQVIRLISQGTLEEKMIELQQKKKSLIEEVIQPSEETTSHLTDEDIRDLLSI